MYRTIVHRQKTPLKHIAEALQSEFKDRKSASVVVVNNMIRLNIGECTVNFTEAQALDYLATLKEAENYR